MTNTPELPGPFHDLDEKALKEAINASVPGGSTQVFDYLDFSAADAKLMGVTFALNEEPPRFHWNSDVRCDELEDGRMIIVGAAIRAYLNAAPAREAQARAEAYAAGHAAGIEAAAAECTKLSDLARLPSAFNDGDYSVERAEAYDLAADTIRALPITAPEKQGGSDV